MKKNIKFVLIAFVLFAFGCQKGEVTDFYNLGSEFLLKSKMTSLDNQAVVTVTNLSKNLTSIEVVHTGILDADGEAVVPTSTALGSISVADGKGTITLTEAQLGVAEIDWKANLKFNAVFDGKPFSRFLTVTVTDPITITSKDAFAHRSDTTYYFGYDVTTATATVSSVKIEKKVSNAGVYSEIAGTWTSADSIPFKGSDYNIGDTIFVKVTAVAGTKSASTTTEIVVTPYSYQNVKTFKLTTEANKAYDFIKAKFVDTTVAGDSADIQLTSTLILGGFDLGLISNKNAQFVIATSEDYDNADIMNIEATDFSNVITSVSALAGDEVYIYRTRRGITGTYSYGIIKIVSVVKLGGVLADSYIEIEYKK